MNRRELLGTAAAFSACALMPGASSAADGVALQSVFDRLLDRSLSASPQTATSYGLDTGARAGLKHRLDDRGPAAGYGVYGPFLDMAGTLKSQLAPIDLRERQWLDTARWFSGAAQEMAAFRTLTVSRYAYPIPYALTQLSGAYTDVPDLLTGQHTIADAADCEAYIDRLAALAGAIDEDTEMSRSQAAAGMIPPDFICDRTIVQLDAFARDRGAGSALVQGLTGRASAAGFTGDWERRTATLVDGPISAAVARQQAYMKGLRARASAEPGLDARRQGRDFYEMALRYHLTVPTSPAEVHQTGLTQVAAIQAQAGTLMDKLGYPTGATVARMNALAKDPAQLYPDTDAGRAALLAFVRERTESMKRLLPAAFDHLPRTPLEVRRVPVALQQGSPFAYSEPGSVDGTRPGAIYFNLSTTADWPKWQIPSTVYHEGIPGHHIQESLANESSSIPTIFKILFPNAYNEGWALYAEQLADELGAYDDAPIGRLGKLQLSLFRSCRLVADTGLHAMGWSRERAIAYLVEEGGVTPETARREVERYVVWPGQACSYKLGYLEIMRQREAARARLGGRFSLKAFHDIILLGGGMPLTVMNEILTTELA